MTLKRLILTALFVALGGSYSFSAFNIVNPSARSAGMGNAFVASGDDASALIGGPAGMAFMKSWDLTFTGSKPYWGVAELGESFAAFVLPLNEVAFTDIGTAGVGWYSFTDTLYSENVFYAAYSVPVPVMTKAALAVSGKYLTKSYKANEWTTANPYFKNLSKSNYSLGVSACANLIKELTLAVFFDDILTPDVGALEVEKLPMTIRGGLKYYFNKSTFVNIEAFSRSRDFKILIGGENDTIRVGDFGQILIRAGAGIGANSFLNICAGFGYRMNIPYLNLGGQLDYGFQFPLSFVEGSAGTHRISLSIREYFEDVKGELTEMEKSKKLAPPSIIHPDTSTESESVTIKIKGKLHEIKSANTYANYFAALSKTITVIFADSGSFNILTKENIDEVLSEKKLKLTGCTSVECAVETGKMLSADDVLIGRVIKETEGSLSIFLKIVDVSTGKVIAADKKYESEVALKEGLPKIVAKIALIKKFQEKKRTVAILELEESLKADDSAVMRPVESDISAESDLISLRVSDKILEIKSSNTEAVYEAVLSKTIAGIFDKIGSFTILTKEKIDEKLNLNKMKLTGCVSVECAVETGKILSADDVLIGSVVKGEKGSLNVSIKIVDVSTGKVIAADKKYESEAALKEGLTRIVAKIAAMKKFQEKKRTIAVLELESK